MPWLVDGRDTDWLQPLDGERPWEVQQIHPSRRFAALSIIARDPRAAVWDLADGKVVWAPEGAQAICWAKDGREVLAVGPLATYSHGWLGRYTWPDGNEIGRREVEMRGYLYESLSVSSVSAVAAIASIDQGETYISMYWLPGTERSPERIADWEDRKSNKVNGLVFAPDGSALVWTLGGDASWWTRGSEWGPSEGGLFGVGRLFVWGLVGDKPGPVETIPVAASLPVGWQPPDPDDMFCSELLHGPFFLNNRRFRVLLPTGDWRTYDLDGNEVPDQDAGRRTSVKDYVTTRLRPLR